MTLPTTPIVVTIVIVVTAVPQAPGPHSRAFPLTVVSLPIGQATSSDYPSIHPFILLMTCFL